MKHKTVPKWVLEKNGFTTQRQFKKMFRKKAKALHKAALDILGYSFYVPEQPWLDILEVIKLSDYIKIGLSQKEWGR